MQVINKQLTAQHYKHCTELRGLDAQWVLPNASSVTANEATQYLGFTVQADGIMLEGCNHQKQFRPDTPQKLEGAKKAAKYLSPRGEYDAMLPKHPTDPYYWTDPEKLKERCWKIDDVPCIVITEGFFTSLGSCSNDIPTIALLGVEMGLTSSKADIQGKRYLVPTLEKYAKAGFGFIIAFDADCATNPLVIEAQRKLVHQIKLFGVPQYNATGLWAVEEGKGMDDYIQNHGADKFKREVLGKVVDIESWERQFNQPTTEEAKKSNKIPAADVVAREIIEDHRDRLLWSDEHKSWMFYSLERKGVWIPVSEQYIEAVVDKILEAKGIIGYHSASYVTNVVAKMRRQLFERVWGERSSSEILPFLDGVFELATGKLHPHAPGHRITWCLPRPYNSVATGWQKIKTWLGQVTGGNEQHEEILLHYAAAVLRGRADLHKFLHLIGIGGSGKSSFTRLMEALIGSQNCWNGSLQDLEDKHSVADLLGKRLVILPDQDKVTGSLSNFKRLTGQDSLRGRRLYKDGLNFRFPGMAIVTSNAPIFHADGGSWLTRRILMLAFNYKPAADKVRDLEAEFEPELSAFTNYLLSIPNEEITRVLRQIGKKDEVSSTLWEAKIRTDSIAAWVNEEVIHDPSAKTQIGCDRDEWAKESYNPSTSTLFGSYSRYCKISGLQAKGKNNFSADLIELVQQTLCWGDVEWTRDKQGRRVIRGLRLRADGEISPFLEDTLTTDDPSDDPSDDLADDLKPLLDIQTDDPDDLTLLKLCSSESNFLEEIQKNDCIEGGSSDDPTVSALQTQPGQGFQVVSEVVSEPSDRSSDSTDHLETPLEVGDRVAGADPYSRNYSWIGEVVKVEAEEILVVWQEGEGITLLIPRSYQRSELRRV